MTFFRRRRLSRLYAAREAAQKRLSLARQRRDTRAIGAALRAVQDTTHALMAEEVKG